MLGQDGVQNVVTFSSQHVQDLLDSEMKQRAAKPHASNKLLVKMFDKKQNSFNKKCYSSITNIGC